MSRSLMLVAALIGSSAAAAISIPAGLNPEGDLLKRDNLPNLPVCATYADKKWQPALDFDKDSCYNVAAISPSGQLNGGLNVQAVAGVTSGCRDKQDLDRTNVYSRSRCNSGWCAHMYGYYFEKDQTTQIGGGHRHDWEHVVVWTQNDRIQYVAVSAHGGYTIRPAKDVHMDRSTHPRVVYHKDGGLTHAFRFGNGADNSKQENYYKTWQYGTLISYYGFPSIGLRNKMMDKDWGSASIDLRDAKFKASLEKARPSAASAFKAGQDGPQDIHNSPGIPEGGCGVRS